MDVRFKAQKNLLDFAKELFQDRYSPSESLAEQDLFSLLLEVMRFLNIASVSFGKDGVVNYEMAKDHAPVILGNIGQYHEESSFSKVIEKVDLVVSKKIDLYDFETFMAEIYVDDGRIEEASDTIKILTKNMNIPGRKPSGRLYRVMGTVDFYLGHIETSKDEFERSLELCNIDNDNDCVGSAYLGLGNIYGVMSSNASAIEYYDRAFASFRETDNKKGMAKAKINLSYVFARTGEIWESNVANSESMELLFKSNDKSLLQFAYLNRTSMLIAHGEYREASESVMNTYYTCTETENRRVFHLARLAMTDIDISRQKPSFKSYIIKALGYFKRISSQIDIAHCYATLAEFHIADKNTDYAVHFMRKSIAVSLKIGDVASVVSAGIKIMRVAVIHKTNETIILKIHKIMLENLTDKRFLKMYSDIVKQFLPFI